LKDTRQISSVQNAERGSLVTIIKRISQNGQIISPLREFPRKYIKPELMNYTPPGSTQACHPAGWIKSQIYTE